MPLRPALLAALTAAALPAAADERYLGVYLGTWHVGTDDLNGVNPGLTYGRRWDAFAPGVEWHLEGGVFYNSYEEVSPIVLGGLSTEIAQLRYGTLRAGLSVGTAYYGELSSTLEDDFGVPNLGGFIPLVAASLAYRREAFEVRLNALPPGGVADAVLNLSLAVPF
jgi:hypothetical protein